MKSQGLCKVTQLEAEEKKVNVQMLFVPVQVRDEEREDKEGGREERSIK